MPISSVLGSTMGAVSSAVGGAAKVGGSAFADLFQRANEARSGSTESATTGEKVGELTREAENQLSEFKHAVQQLFASAGIDTTWQSRLQSDGQGGIQANADHPDCEKIEQLIRDNPDLIEKFNKLQETYARLRSSSGESSKSDASAFSVVFAEEGVSAAFE